MEWISKHFQKLRYNSVGEHLPPVCTTQDLIPNIGKKIFSSKNLNIVHWMLDAI